MMQFFLLQNTLLVIFIIVGFWCSKRKNVYPIIVIAILLYTIIEGLRFGRGIDYNLYYDVYDQIENSSLETNHEVLFISLCRLLIFLGIPYQGFILLCSFILITCGVSFLKKHSEVLLYSLPLFFSVSLLAENLIRWFLGFSFVLLALSALSEGHNIKFVIWSVLGGCFHYGLFFVIIPFFIISRIKQILLPPWIAIGLYFILAVVWSNDFMLNFSNLVNILFSTSERFSMYAMDADSWLMGANREQTIIPFTTHIRLFCTYTYLLFVGKKVVIEKPQLLLFYNILCVGIILFPVMQPIELFFRINYLFMFFQILIAAYCFYFTFSQKKRINIGLRCLGFLVLLFYINNIEGKFLISDPYKTMYIWDAGNLKSLPIDLFMDE